MNLPNDIINQFEKLEKSTDEMLKEMVMAAAAEVEDNIRANVPSSWHDSDIMRCLKVTEPYKTPSDDGINVKVAFYGYFTDKNGRRHPAPAVGNVTEFGRSSSRYPKHPFLRRSFDKKKIEEAMLKVQQRYIED